MKYWNYNLVFRESKINRSYGGISREWHRVKFDDYGMLFKLFGSGYEVEF